MYRPSRSCLCIPILKRKVGSFALAGKPTGKQGAETDFEAFARIRDANSKNCPSWLFDQFAVETKNHPDLAREKFAPGKEGWEALEGKTRDMFNALGPEERAALKVRAFHAKKDFSSLFLFSVETKNHPDLSMSNFPPGSEGRLARSMKLGEMFRALSKEERANLKKRADAKENRKNNRQNERGCKSWSARNEKTKEIPNSLRPKERAALYKVRTAKPEKTFLPSAEMFRALSSQEIAALSANTSRTAPPSRDQLEGVSASSSVGCFSVKTCTD